MKASIVQTPCPAHSSSVALGAGGLEANQEILGIEQVSFLPVPHGISCHKGQGCSSFVPTHRQEGLVAARLTNGAVLVPPAVPHLVNMYPQLFWGMDWVIPPASKKAMEGLLLQPGPAQAMPGIRVSQHSPQRHTAVSPAGLMSWFQTGSFTH